MLPSSRQPVAAFPDQCRHRRPAPPPSRHHRSRPQASRSRQHRPATLFSDSLHTHRYQLIPNILIGINPSLRFESFSSLLTHTLLVVNNLIPLIYSYTYLKRTAQTARAPGPPAAPAHCQARAKAGLPFALGPITSAGPRSVG